MKKLMYLFITFFISIFFQNCKEDSTEKSYSLSGYGQKGPFSNGSSVIISELDSKLIPTGRMFSTNIEDNKGIFHLQDVKLISPFVQVMLNGFYFDEINGKLSEAPLTLFSIANIEKSPVVNVNLLTHLEKARVEKLIKEGKTFDEAKSQAQKEVLGIFNLENSNWKNPEGLDITKAGEENANLLSVSVILQNSRSVAELSQLLADIIADIKDDGQLDSVKIQSEVVSGTRGLDFEKIKNNLITKYDETGSKIEIADFESKVDYFIKNTNFKSVSKITFPESGNYGINFFTLPDGANVLAPAIYSIAIVLPKNTKVRFEIKQLTDSAYWGFMLYSEPLAWKIGSYGGSNQTLTTDREGLTDYNIRLDMQGTASFGLFENDATEPFLSKKISWHFPVNPIFNKPVDTKYGKNLLCSKDGDILQSGSQYGIAVDLSNEFESFYMVELSRLSGDVTFKIDRSKSLKFDINLMNENSEFKITLTSHNLGTKDTDISAIAPIVFQGKGECLIRHLYHFNFPSEFKIKIE